MRNAHHEILLSLQTGVSTPTFAIASSLALHDQLSRLRWPTADQLAESPRTEVVGDRNHNLQNVFEAK